MSKPIVFENKIVSASVTDYIKGQKEHFTGQNVGNLVDKRNMCNIIFTDTSKKHIFILTSDRTKYNLSVYTFTDRSNKKFLTYDEIVRLT